jgi:phosphoribosyl 1,2-cyclic phosphate phosphodiesterase
MRVTVLGCGTSSGVPMIGCACAVCRSTDPRNHRRRCSILVESRGQTILVDTGPDLRMQLLDAGVAAIDALLYSHAHADHVHGIDDLRSLNNAMERAIDAYAHAAVFARIRSRFEYAFHDSHNTYGFWRPALRPHEIEGPFRIGEVVVQPIRQGHGRGESWGFRFDRFAYSTDCDHLDEAAFAALAGVEVWIVDALREEPHPSHAHLERTLGWIERVAPRQAFLTHMNHEVDYATWAARLPKGVLPAHDGLVLELAETPTPSRAAAVAS